MARGTSGRRSGRRTDYEWLSLRGKITALDLTVNATGLGDGGLQVTGPGTFMRARGHAFLQLDAGGADERVLIALGLIIISNEAFAAGAGSIPAPGNDEDADWLWHNYVGLSSLAEAAVQSDALFARVEIDSKAMRKVKPQQTLAFLAEVLLTEDQTGTLDVLYGVRILGGS